MSMTQGTSIIDNLNTSIRNMLIPNPEMEWAWIVGDDHTFRSDVLERLLVHDKDIVVPLCPLRSVPFNPSVFKPNPPGPWVQMEWSEIQLTGLQKIRGTGYAGGLFKRRVFEKLGDPWWDIGPFSPDPPYAPKWGEDLWFCQKVQNAGFDIWLDPTVHVGHITTCILEPTWEQETGWGVAVDMGHRIIPSKTLAAD